MASNAIIAVDVGNNTYSFGRYFECDRHAVLMSGYLGSIGFSFPAAMGAWSATQEDYPRFKGRQVISVSGDGGFGQYLAEINTAVKYGMNITHVLMNNGELGKISKEQRAGNWEVWQTSLHNPEFAAYAELCGAMGIRVTKADDLDAAFEKALSHPGPALVEVMPTPTQSWCSRNARRERNESAAGPDRHRAVCAIFRADQPGSLAPPMVFVLLGLVLSPVGLGWIELTVDNKVVHVIAEITLILVLFTDAARINLKHLWADHDLPLRLLLVGMPLTIVAGALAAKLILPELIIIEEALILAVILAPTDAALGASGGEQSACARAHSPVAQRGERFERRHRAAGAAVCGVVRDGHAR